MKHSSKLESEGHMNENAIHGSPKKGGEWRIALRVRTYAIMKHISKLESGGHMNENAINGNPKKGVENGELQ